MSDENMYFGRINAPTAQQLREQHRNHRDPYEKNIYTAAVALCARGWGFCEYRTQYTSGQTLWYKPTTSVTLAVKNGKIEKS